MKFRADGRRALQRGRRWLALDYFNRRPGSVERTALRCPAGIGRQKNLLLKAEPLLLLGPWGARMAREPVFGRSDGVVPDVARPFIDMMTLIGLGVRPRIVDILRLNDADLAGRAMPMLVILGGKDVLIDTAEARRRLERHAPNAVVRWLPDAPLHPGSRRRDPRLPESVGDGGSVQDCGGQSAVS